MSVCGSDSARLFLVRHGQASLGSEDYDRLSATGHRQAERVARRLASSSVPQIEFWSGTLLRHRQTLAPLIADGGHEVRRTADLDEFSTSGLVRAGLERARALDLPVPPRAQLLDPVTHLDRLLAWFPQVMSAWQAGDLDQSAVGSWPDFQERVLRPSGDWKASLRAGRSVAAVTSAGVISTIVAALGAQGLARQRRLAVSLYNASVTELSLVGDRWQVLSCNCTRHLDVDELRTLA